MINDDMNNVNIENYAFSEIMRSSKYEKEVFFLGLTERNPITNIVDFNNSCCEILKPHIFNKTVDKLTKKCIFAEVNKAKKQYIINPDYGILSDDDGKPDIPVYIAIMSNFIAYQRYHKSFKNIKEQENKDDLIGETICFLTSPEERFINSDE